MGADLLRPAMALALFGYQETKVWTPVWALVDWLSTEEVWRLLFLERATLSQLWRAWLVSPEPRAGLIGAPAQAEAAAAVHALRRPL